MVVPLVVHLCITSSVQYTSKFSSALLLFSVSSSSVLLCSDLVVGVAKALLTSSFVVKVLNVTTSTKKKVPCLLKSVKTSKKSIRVLSVFDHKTTFPFKLDGVLYIVLNRVFLEITTVG